MFGFGKKKAVSPKLDVVTLSECGLVRSDNQDSVFVDTEARVVCVADGMGGGAEGGRASRIVCEHLRRAKLGAELRPLEDVAESIGRALADAHAEISAYAQEKGFEQMGSTAAVLAFDGYDFQHAYLCHIGDSRVYRIRKGMAELLTRDHTVGMACAEFAGKNAAVFRDRKNPLAHVLTRAIGVTQGPIRADGRTIDVRVGDRFVVCSDGVHDVITDPRLAVFAGGGTLASARDRLKKEVLAKGAPDNFSFVLAEVVA